MECLADMTGAVWSLDLGVGVLSVIITASILVLYVRRLTEVRSSFLKGLAAISGVFLAESLISVFSYYRLSQSYSSAVATPLLVIGILDLVGFAVLLWIARQ